MEVPYLCAVWQLTQALSLGLPDLTATQAGKGGIADTERGVLRWKGMFPRPYGKDVTEIQFQPPFIFTGYSQAQCSLDPPGEIKKF